MTRGFLRLVMRRRFFRPMIQLCSEKLELLLQLHGSTKVPSDLELKPIQASETISDAYSLRI